MVAVRVGVVYVAFTSPGIAVPPVDAVYQRYCPLVPPLAESTTVVPLQPVAPVDAGGAGTTDTVSVAAVVVALIAPEVTTH